MTRTSELPAARKFLCRHTRRGGRLLCAVSGGLDSMCLLHLLSQWGPANQRQVAAAHFNHQLRAAAGRDEAFVRDWCGRHDIPFFSGAGDTRALAEKEGLSIEEAARKLRYAFLRQTARREGCAAVLTAHHADDNAETILLNLVRGTGLTGLCGIAHTRHGVLRPFLQSTRAELAAYAAAHGISYLEDETNLDPDAAARNLLRLQVMPLLKELNPRAVEHMGATARQLYAVDSFLEEEARRRTARAKVEEGRVTLPLQALEEAPSSVRSRMLLRLFDLLGAGRKDIGAVHLDAIEHVARGTHGRAGGFSLPHGMAVRRGGNALILEKRPALPEEAELKEDQPLRWGTYTLALLKRREGEGLALRLREDDTVTVAPCPPGERLTLPGARGSRSVKRLCLDQRIGLEERDGLPGIYVGGRLAAVWRLGVDREFLPEADVCRFIQIIKDTEEK